MSQPLHYDPYSEEVIENPQAIYARLREEAPCYHLEKWDAYALSRFEDIWNCSMDAANFTAEKGTTASHLLTKVQPVTPMINMMDPPTHTELRAKIAKAFTPGVVRKLESTIQGFVDDEFAPIADQPGADLFNDFAAKVSVKVACLANGFPMEDAEYLNGLVWRFFGREEGVDGMTEDGLAAMNEMFGYFIQLIAKRRAAAAGHDQAAEHGREQAGIAAGVDDLETAGTKLRYLAACEGLWHALVDTAGPSDELVGVER